MSFFYYYGDALFNRLDVNRSGYVTYNEVANYYARVNSVFGPRYSSNDVNRFFQIADLNRDGVISLGEMRACFNPLPPILS